MTLFEVGCLVLSIFTACGVVMGLVMLAAYLKDASEFDDRLAALEEELQDRFEAQEKRTTEAEKKISRAGLDFLA